MKEGGEREGERRESRTSRIEGIAVAKLGCCCYTRLQLRYA